MLWENVYVCAVQLTDSRQIAQTGKKQWFLRVLFSHAKVLQVVEHLLS